MATLRRDLSFTADLYWEDSEHRWQDVYVSYVDGIAEEEHGWLYVGERDKWNSPYIFLRQYRFWFWCYEEGGQYWFDIRAGRVRHKIEYQGQLDCSRKGYVGLYNQGRGISAVDADLANEIEVGLLWHLDDFDPSKAVPGEAWGRIKLFSPHGHKITRSAADARGFHYLQEAAGDPVSLALNIVG